MTEQIEDAKAFNPALKLAGVLITSYQNTDGEAAGVELSLIHISYQKGYADAMEDMRKKKEQRRQREQEKKARRWYFIKLKAYGFVMLAVTVLAVWATEGDITIAAVSYTHLDVYKRQDCNQYAGAGKNDAGAAGPSI